MSEKAKKTIKKPEPWQEAMRKAKFGKLPPLIAQNPKPPPGHKPRDYATD